MYVARQDELDAPSQDEINAMDQEMDTLKANNVSLKEEVRQLSGGT